MYYGPIGIVVCQLVGLAVSFACGANRGADSDPRLFYPLFARLAFFLPDEWRRALEFDVPYESDVKVPGITFTSTSLDKTAAEQPAATQEESAYYNTTFVSEANNVGERAETRV